MKRTLNWQRTFSVELCHLYNAVLLLSVCKNGIGTTLVYAKQLPDNMTSENWQRVVLLHLYFVCLALLFRL